MDARTKKLLREFAVAIAFALVVAACGGGSKSGVGPSPTPTPSAGDGTPSPATITIANNAVSPRNITVTRGSRVTFLNNDTQSHDMQSDPHPVHTDCPEIAQVGLLNPGQSKQTGIFNTARTCGYHDHTRDMLESLQGTITVQ